MPCLISKRSLKKSKGKKFLYAETNDNKNRTIQNLWGTAKVIPKQKL